MIVIAPTAVIDLMIDLMIGPTVFAPATVTVEVVVVFQTIL